MKIFIISKSFVVKNGLEMYFNNKNNTSNIFTFSNLNIFKNEHISKKDIIFIDIDKNINFEHILEIKNRYKDTKIIILDQNKDLENLNKALINKIECYITNLNDEDEFNLIIKKIFSGESFYDSDFLLNYINSINNIDNKTIIQNLTYREKDILKLVSNGSSNKNIADKLFLSENTVKKHITNILNKLKLNNRKELIIYYKELLEH